MPTLGESNTDLVPFGKYRGQPLDTLFADRGYLQWLLAQAWFAQQYAELHRLVINYGVLPEETPEHNALQLCFLAPALRIQTCNAWLAFRRQYGPQSHITRRPKQLYGIPEIKFEEHGIDVSLTYTVAVWDEVAYRRDYRTITENVWTSNNESFGVELKPSLGDDYPAVLRKMLRGSGSILVYEAWQSQMPVSQVEQLFAHSVKCLLSLEELRTYPSHIQEMPTEPPNV